MTRRYPLEPLRRLSWLSRGEFAKKVSVGGKDYARYWSEGVSWKVADRIAGACGFHPAEVWPEWFDEAEAARRAALNAGERRRYIDDDAKRARRIEQSRRYWWENHDYVLAQKRRRAADLDPEVKKTRRRAHYERHREAILAKKRATYAERVECKPTAPEWADMQRAARIIEASEPFAALLAVWPGGLWAMLGDEPDDGLRWVLWQQTVALAFTSAPWPDEYWKGR